MAPLKKAIDALDPAGDKKTQITLLLTLLSELCAQKVGSFTEAIETELRTAGTVENRTIPVTEILARHTEYRAYIKSDAGKLATETASAIKRFITGGSEAIVDGIASLVTTGLEAIIGAGSGSQQEMSSYYIVVQKFGILRFDIRVWSRQIEATGITDQIENALAIVAYKSSVDVSKITLNTFLITYQDQLGKLNIDEGRALEYLAAAEELYYKLRGGLPTALSAPSQPLMTPNPHIAMIMRVPGQLYGSAWEEGMQP